MLYRARSTRSVEGWINELFFLLSITLKVSSWPLNTVLLFLVYFFPEFNAPINFCDLFVYEIVHRRSSSEFFRFSPACGSVFWILFTHSLSLPLCLPLTFKLHFFVVIFMLIIYFVNFFLSIFSTEFHRNSRRFCFFDDNRRRKDKFLKIYSWNIDCDVLDWHFSLTIEFFHLNLNFNCYNIISLLCHC